METHNARAHHHPDLDGTPFPAAIADDDVRRIRRQSIIFQTPRF
jgi:hypothetical protein